MVNSPATVKFTQKSVSIEKLGDISSDRWHQIIILRSQVFVYEQKCVYIDPDTTDAGALHATIIEQDQLVGYARIYQDDAWHLGRIVTDPSWRGKGVSKALMEACLQYIKETNPGPEITLSAQVYLTDFYRKIGFEPRGSMYLEDGIPHLEMVFTTSL